VVFSGTLTPRRRTTRVRDEGWNTDEVASAVRRTRGRDGVSAPGRERSGTTTTKTTIMHVSVGVGFSPIRENSGAKRKEKNAGIDLPSRRLIVYTSNRFALRIPVRERVRERKTRSRCFRTFSRENNSVERKPGGSFTEKRRVRRRRWHENPTGYGLPDTRTLPAGKKYRRRDGDVGTRDGRILRMILRRRSAAKVRTVELLR